MGFSERRWLVPFGLTTLTLFAGCVSEWKLGSGQVVEKSVLLRDQLAEPAPSATPTVTVSSTPPPAGGDSSVASRACDHVIEPNTNPAPLNYTVFDAGPDGAKVAPGQTICLKGGRTRAIKLSNVNGTAEKPILIKNTDGVVVIDETLVPSSEEGFNNGANGIQRGRRTQAFHIIKSWHFRLSGSGDPKHPYGIKVQSASRNADDTPLGRSSGLEITGFSRDYEVDHVEVTGVSYGVYARTATDSGYACNEEDAYREFVAAGGTKNVKIHHTYVHDVAAKGFFMATSGCRTNVSVTCSGVAKTFPTDTLNNAEVAYNRVENTGYQIFQLGCGENNRLHHNVSGAHGLRGISDESAGYNFQGAGEIYANRIISASSKGSPLAFGVELGNVKVYNNVVSAHPDHRVVFFKVSATVERPTAYFVNNTIVGGNELAGFYGASADGIVAVPVEFRNNLLVGIIDANNRKDRLGLNGVYSGGSKITRMNDFSVDSPDGLFVDPAAGNFTPDVRSQVVQDGVLNRGGAPGVTMTLDYFDNPRVKGDKIDVGAVEVQSN